MEKDWKLLSPLGVSDVLESDCALKNRIETAISGALGSFGYNEIQTPTFEYFDVFADDLSISTEDVIKFIDKSGRVLALRPDYTTAISRLMASHKAETPLPMRLRYCGSIFRGSESYTEARQKEFTQAGAELFGPSTPEADAEIVIATIDALLRCGLTEFQLELGHTEFLRGIVEGRLDEEQLAELTELLDRKFILGIEEFCERAGLDSETSALLSEMPNLYGDYSVAEKVAELPLSGRSRAAIENLLAVCGAVRDYGYEKYISVDLGLVRSFKYYTGIVFKGLTYGVAFPICGGGRYDGLADRFGVHMPATGVAIWTDRVMTAMIRQHRPDTMPEIDLLVWYSEGGRSAAYALAREQREKGLRVLCERHDNFDDEALRCKYMSEHRINQAVKAGGDC